MKKYTGICDNVPKCEDIVAKGGGGHGNAPKMNKAIMWGLKALRNVVITRQWKESKRLKV
jgi:hypothetical protein